MKDITNVTSKYLKENQMPVTRIQRSDYITAAKELCYPKIVVQRLKEAVTVGECERIMRDARKKWMDDEY